MVFVVLALVFLVVPILELWGILTVADQIGVPETILVLIGIALLGSYLMKRAGLGVLGRISERTSKGELPADELVDGGLVLAAGALMLTPGFFTDIFGILFLLPPTRALFRPPVKRWAERKVKAKVAVFGVPWPSGGADGRGMDGGFVDVHGYERGESGARTWGDDPMGPRSLEP
jgi:UPF0716 protein FxsA